MRILDTNRLDADARCEIVELFLSRYSIAMGFHFRTSWTSQIERPLIELCCEHTDRKASIIAIKSALLSLYAIRKAADEE